MIPTITQIPTVILTYSTTTITLPSPDFNNQHVLEKTRVNTQSRGLTNIVFSESNWPQRESMLFKFTKITKSLKDSYLNFLELSLGKLIELTDHESRDWEGLILTPSDPVSDEGRNCAWSFQFTFKGTLT